ncbi:MAG: hypothetical protein RBT80_00700 [Candidatus Vecturithrix sp.]|nr:hypothetical protein [Candidatus Vecturithrix sp.]
MLNQILQCLHELSSLHVVPYSTWTQDAIVRLETFLEGTPYCLTPHGNLFLGEDQFEHIQPGKICLQAHLDHPGGILHANQQAQYLFAKYYGINARLTGYSLGVYEPGTSEKIDQIEVENAVFQERDQATCLFFKNNRKLSEALPERTFIIHHDAMPEMTESTISNWNLDDLIHCALIIALIKRKVFSDSVYGLLTHNEEVAQEGIRGWLHEIADTSLFFLNLDMIDTMLPLKTPDDEPYQYMYGIRAEQSGIKLDQPLFPELINDVGRDYLAKIPVGKCEGHIMQEQSTRFMAMFLKIDHYHNGLNEKKFTAESLSVERFSHYLDFVQHTIVKINEYLAPNLSAKFITSPQPEFPGTIHIVDHVEAIKDILDRCHTFSEYLYIGVPKLRTIYDNYQIPMPAITGENFEGMKGIILNGKYPDIRASQVHEWKTKIINELAILFDHIFQVQEKPVTLVKLALADFNARCTVRPERILLSVEQIPESELDRVLIHELTHYLTADIWSFQNMSPVKREYYSEGLAVVLSRKLLNVSLATALNMRDDDLTAYLDNITQLKLWNEEYLTGNVCSFFQGKYHQYFQKKEVVEPFVANGQQYQRYGYVLAALETQELMEKGGYDDHLFCQSISECDRP